MTLAASGAAQPLPVNGDGRPLYQRLLARLREEIDSGRLRAGDQFPPELEIARQLGISRHTVRQAIVELVREGLVLRERGRGTVVMPRPLVQSLGAFYSFEHELRDRGLPYRTRLVHRRLTPASGEAAARLEVPEGSPMIELEMLRLVEDIPLSLEFSVTPFACAPALLDADLTCRTVYEVMAECHDIRVTFGREQLRPVVLDERQARLLGVAAGSPAFHVDRRTLAEASPVEWRRSLVRGDRCLYRIDLPR